MIGLFITPVQIDNFGWLYPLKYQWCRVLMFVILGITFQLGYSPMHFPLLQLDMSGEGNDTILLRLAYMDHLFVRMFCLGLSLWFFMHWNSYHRTVSNSDYYCISNDVYIYCVCVRVCVYMPNPVVSMMLLLVNSYRAQWAREGDGGSSDRSS